MIGLVRTAKDCATGLQLRVHGHVFPLETSDLKLAVREGLLHIQIALFLGRQDLLHRLPLVVHLSEQRVALAVYKNSA